MRLDEDVIARPSSSCVRGHAAICSLSIRSHAARSTSPDARNLWRTWSRVRSSNSNLTSALLPPFASSNGSQLTTVDMSSTATTTLARSRSAPSKSARHLGRSTACCGERDQRPVSADWRHSSPACTGSPPNHSAWLKVWSADSMASSSASASGEVTSSVACRAAVATSSTASRPRRTDSPRCAPSLCDATPTAASLASSATTRVARFAA
mmetsp:Transcript_18216/g.46973  ORF Transcript_18216/g.46973 Transcript_18216/m.46973 type:complete len:210 (-) Transcript_18216:334-963(-)